MSDVNRTERSRSECERALELLSVAFDDVLTESEEADLERHLRACASCSAECDRLGELHDALATRPAPRLTPFDLERNVGAIRARLEREPPIDLDAPDEAQRSVHERAATAGPRRVLEGHVATSAERRGALAADEARTELDGPTPVRSSNTRTVPTRSTSARSFSVRRVAVLVAAASVIVVGLLLWRASRDAEPTPLPDVADARTSPSPTLVRDDEGSRAAVGDGGASDTGASNAAVQATRDPAPPDTASSPSEAAIAGLASSGVASSDSTSSTTAPIDHARLTAARVTAERALVEGEPLLAAHDVDGFVAHVDEALASWKDGGWPVVRLVERSLAHPDPAIARAAMRWLGRRGDALAARALAPSLTDPDAKFTAVAALLDLRVHGEDALIGAFRDDAVRERVLDDVAARDPHAASSLLERAVRRSSRPLSAVTAFAEVGRRTLAPATPWVEALALERGASEPEVAEAGAFALVAVGDVAALRALLRLRASPRIAPEHVDPGVGEFSRMHGDVVARLVRESVAARRFDELRQLDDAMQDSPCAALVPAWIELSRTTELGRASRRTAVLLVGELGAAHDVPALIEVYRACSRRERDVKAAALIAIHALGGLEPAQRVLEASPPKVRARALALLEEFRARDTPQITLLELAQELEPQLAPLSL